MNDKCMCAARRCGWFGLYADVLCAPSPFDSGEQLMACPECKTVEQIFVACDEPGCWNMVDCGTPTPSGYRQTCGKHVPRGA